jgi:peroxiredoxin
VFQFIEAVKPNPRIFQFATSFFLNSAINSNIMGMDALFVDIARKYYLSGEAFWASEESLEKIRENVLFAENNLIGKTAPDLTLESFEGEYVNLHQIDAKYTLVVIYEPNCSHCNVFVPDLYANVYQPFKDKGLEVFAIYSMDNKAEWGEFLTEHNLFDWINVWDEHHVSRFKILYDARKTPGVYVLDENKKIVAKKMTVEQLKLFLEK